MVINADTTIVPEFLDTALARLEADPDFIAVGGVFYGDEGAGLVGQLLQRNEYTRYQRYISRRLGRVVDDVVTDGPFGADDILAVKSR